MIWISIVHKSVKLKVEDYDKQRALVKLDELKDRFVISETYRDDIDKNLQGLYIARFEGWGRRKMFKRKVK